MSLLLTIAQAQEEDEEIVEISDYKPVTLPPDQTIKAMDLITNTVLDLIGEKPSEDLSSEEAFKRTQYRLWLDNVTNLTNVTEVA